MSSLMLSNVTKEYLHTFDCILDSMIQDMTHAELTDSISQNFIVQMIPHHRAAIEMSENLLQYTTCIPLQEIALQIIEKQTKSIEAMRRALGACKEVENTEQDLCLYQKQTQQILQTMFSAMRHARSTNHLNCNFMREMIPHHKGAVRMSENALQYTLCPALHAILQAIIVSQKRGIRQMQQLMQGIGCAEQNLF